MDNNLQRFIQALYIEYGRDLYQRAYQLLGDQGQAEELLQETFLIAARKAQQLQEHPNIIGWLHKTLSNLIYKQWQKINITAFPFGDDIERFPAEWDGADLAQILPQGLSEQEQHILLLRYQDNYSYQEIANILGISQSACGMRLQRAIKHCRALLEKEKII